MGLLRLLLAISVVDFHAVQTFGADRLFGLRLPNGIVAVQMFFVISGFYMSLVLSDKYAARTLAFYMSRFLRLFPSYWIVSAATIALILFYGDPRAAHWANVFESGETWTITAALFTNVFLIGQDWLFFSGNLSVILILIIPPAWTLSLEICFYALAPFIVRMPTVAVLGLLGASITFRHFMFLAGYNGDPWIVRFFPFELSWFLFGLLGHRVYERIKAIKGAHWVSYSALAAAIVMIMFCGHFQDLSNQLGMKDSVYVFQNFTVLAAFVVLVPFAFLATRDSSIDRQIGELSYPVYLVHMMVLTFLMPKTGAMRAELAVACSIAISIVIMLITAPIERWRGIKAAPTQAA